MAVFKVETKDKVNIAGKPRVYFTCHADDFEKYFKIICDDLFKTHNCAIYYTEDMSASISNDEKVAGLGRSNLLVFPVSYKLLTTPNRAMDEDIPYALEKCIPVLPIMMETGIEEIYSQNDKLGELQYLNPYSMDLSEIPYEEKLKKYLELVLISDELAKRVRKAFGAYIFLSYRKKDRKYANELMHLIHSIPQSRDIAIWFDEFLTPGESYKDNIEKALDRCKLFTLLVTPRLLEKVVDENGEEQDNYVISTELPLAQKKKKEKGTDIFAVEMEATDRKTLYSMDVWDCVNVNDCKFRVRLLDTVSRLGIAAKHSPEHNFLIGLAYLTGIDVEVNIEMGLQLIESAASAELTEAMKVLVSVYYVGIGIKKDIILAVNHQKRYTEYLRKKMQESDARLLEYLSEELRLAEMETEADLLKQGRNTCWRVIKLCRSNEGYGPFFTEDRIEYYIHAYILLGKIFKKRDDVVQSKECYDKACKVLNQLPDSQKRLVDSFVYGCLHYHLGEIHSREPFYDSRYTVSNYKSALQCFEQCDQMHSEQNVQVYIDNCKIKLAAEYEKRLSQREEAIQIYLNLSDQYMQLDYQGSLDEVYVKAHCLYRLGELYQKQQNTEKAQAAYQNAVGLCSKARETNEDDLRIMRLFLLSSVKLLNLNATNSSAEEYKRLRVLAENYHKRFPTRQASQLLAEVYFELQREDAGFLRMAYSIYETLCNEYPEIYSSDLWRFRKYMWGKKLLDEPYFQKRTLPIFLQDKNRFWFGIDSMAKTKYAFELFFVACEPLGEIEKITITEYKYKSLMRDTVSQRQIAPPTQFLQICEIKTDQRAALIPDERVLITYKNGKTVEYAVCFG